MIMQEAEGQYLYDREENILFSALRSLYTAGETQAQRQLFDFIL